MGWMIGAIAVLVATNLWTWRSWRRSTRSAADSWCRSYEDRCRSESEIRCAIYDAMGEGWRENMAYCGGGYNRPLSNLDLVHLLIQKYGQGPGLQDEDDDRDYSNDPDYIQYLKDMEEAEDELEALCPGGQNN